MEERGKGRGVKEGADEKTNVYSLGSQHTVTRNFIHGRGGPSSVGRAGKSKTKEGLEYAAYLLNLRVCRETYAYAEWDLPIKSAL